MGTSGFPFLFPLLAELQTHLFKTVLGLIGIDDPAHGRPIGDSLGGYHSGYDERAQSERSDWALSGLSPLGEMRKSNAGAMFLVT